MTASDPAKPLKEFQPKHTFFVGIDSDGSVFDTMGIKQRMFLSLADRLGGSRV